MRHKINIEKLISVIIVTYNRKSYLYKALKSCQNQINFEELEIIIVDNGSTDGTQQISKEFSKYKYIKIPKSKISHARNIGIKASNCNYITFLDSDDILLPNKLSLQYKYMRENDIDFSYTNYHLYSNNELICYPFEKLKKKFWKSFFPYGSTSFMFTKKCTSFNNTFDKRLIVGEDWDFFIKCKRNGMKIKNINIPLFLYRIHDNNISFNREINHQLFWFYIRLKNRLNPFKNIDGYNQTALNNLQNYKIYSNKIKRERIFSYLELISE